VTQLKQSLALDLFVTILGIAMPAPAGVGLNLDNKDNIYFVTT